MGRLRAAFFVGEWFMTQESRLAIVIDSTKAKPSADELTRAMNALDAAGVRVTSTTNNVNQSVDQMARQTDAAARALRRGLIAVFGGISAMGIIDMADEWGQMASRIRMATESTEEYERVQARMLQSANATYRNINETREAFVQLSPVLRQMGMSLDESMDAIDAFSGLMVTNAASTERGAAAMRALSVSLQKGKMDADQWITIYSTLDSIVDTIAAHSGMAAEEIRKLGASGQLSVKLIAQALAGQLDPIMQQVEEMPTTVRDAFQKVGNEFSEYIGTANEANRVTETVADGIVYLGENLASILNAGAIAGAGALAVYTSRLIGSTAATVADTIAKRSAAIQELDLAKAQSAQAAATLAQAKAQQGLTATRAQLASATAANIAAEQRLAAAQAGVIGAGRSLLGVLGGPVGILTTVGLTAAAFIAMGSDARAATSDIVGLATATDKLTRAQLESAKFKADDVLAQRKKDAEEASIALAGVQKDYEALEEAFQQGRGVTAEELQNVNRTLVEQQAELDKAGQRLAEAQKHADALAQAMDRLSGSASNANDELANTRAEWLAKYATQAEKLNAELDKAREAFGGMIPSDIEERIRKAFEPRGAGAAKQISEGQRYIEQMREQIALLGKETELEQLLARVASGSLEFRTTKQRELAEELAKTFDATQKQIELEEVLRDLREQQTTTQMQFFRELEAFGQGDRVRQLNADLAKVEDRYRGIIDARRNSPLGLSDEELAQIQASLQRELDIVRWFHEQKLQKAQDWSLGARNALTDYADEAANVYDSVGRLASNAFKGMEDSLVNFVRTGKLEFSDFANSIISDMIRIAIQQSVTGPLAMAFSGWLSGPTAPAGVTPGLDWTFSGADGGYTGDGGKYEVAGIVHRGEGVLNQEEIRALGGEAGFNALRRAIRTGHAAGGMAGRPTLPPSASPSGSNVSVNIINNSSQPISAGQPKVSMDQMGRMVVDVMIEDLRRNGPYARQLKGGM